MATSIAVIYHPKSNSDRRVTDDVIRGIHSEAVRVVSFSLADALKKLHELDAFDGLVFANLSNDARNSGDFKRFMRASREKSDKGQWRDKVTSAFSSALALTAESLPMMLQLSLFSARHNMIWVEQGAFRDSVASEYTDPAFCYGQYLARVTKHWHI